MTEVTQKVEKLWSNKCEICELYLNRENLTDPFTKELSWNVIENASREMGIRPI
jgi:hypothetical protein